MKNKKYKDSASRVQNGARTDSAEAQPVLERKLKDSGIPWIGLIPEDWSVRKLRTLGRFSASGIDKLIVEGEPLLRIINYVDVYNNLLYELHEKDYMVVSAPQVKIDEHQVGVGDMIFTPSSETTDDIGVSSVVMEELPNTAYSYHVLRFRSNEEMELHYKKYICNNRFVAQYFSSRCNGTIRKTVSREVFKECPVLLPPLPTQQRIADFLDRKCAEIDELSALQETMIAELKRYKQSVITEAVTGKMKVENGKLKVESGKLKDSGVEWIGDIPEGWEVKKGKHILSLQKREVRADDEVVTCFRDGEVVLRKERREDGFTMSDKEIGYQGINKGDIVIHGMDGFAGAMGVSKSTGKGSPVLIVCIPSHNDYPQYIIYYLRTLAMRNVFLALATGIRERSCDLRWNKISELAFLLPPLTEQQAIADYLDEKCSEFDELIAIKQQKIEQLKEYKKSVIFEYVTGKKEVQR